MTPDDFERQLLALELNEAIEICDRAGIEVEVRYTRPPRGNPSGRNRVVRVILLTPEKGELTVSQEVQGKEV